MSNNTSNTPNGVGDKKELKVKRDIPEEEINRDIENWAAQRDEKGNIVPGTDGKSIAVVFGNPYFKDNVVDKEQEDEGSGSTDGTTVMSDQGKKSLEEVKEGMYIQTKSPEQSKESDKKKSSNDKKKDREEDEASRD